MYQIITNKTKKHSHLSPTGGQEEQGSAGSDQDSPQQEFIEQTATEIQSVAGNQAASTYRAQAATLVPANSGSQEKAS